MQPETSVFVVGDGDKAARLLDLFAQQDRPEDLASFAFSLERANTDFLLWAQRVGGAGIAGSGDGFWLVAPAEKMGDLPALMRGYEGATGCTVSVGVGGKLSEAYMALKAAKKRGGDRAVLYTPEIAQEVAEKKEEAPLFGKSELPVETDPARGGSGGLPETAPVPADLSADPVPSVAGLESASPVPISSADLSASVPTLADEVRGLVRGQLIAEARKRKAAAAQADGTRQRLMEILRGFHDVDGLRSLVRAAPGLADALSDLVALLPAVARSLPQSVENASTPTGGAEVEDEAADTDPALAKAAGEKEGAGVGGVHLLPGSVKDGKLAVVNPETGREKWVGGRAGLVRNPTTGTAASALRPNG